MYSRGRLGERRRINGLVSSDACREAGPSRSGRRTVLLAERFGGHILDGGLRRTHVFNVAKRIIPRDFPCLDGLDQRHTEIGDATVDPKDRFHP